MIIRIVKLTLQTEQLPGFLDHFETIKSRIRAFPGCSRLELLAQTSDPAVLFTYSHWETEEHLNQYLRSPFFKETWSKVKPMFAAPAEAWSLNRIAGDAG